VSGRERKSGAGLSKPLVLAANNQSPSRAELAAKATDVNGIREHLQHTLNGLEGSSGQDLQGDA